MDNLNFRGKKRHGSSIDGFVQPKKSAHKGSDGSGGDLASFNQYYRPEKPTGSRIGVAQPNLEGFSRQSVDGFNLAVQTPIESPARRGKAAEIVHPFEHEQKTASPHIKRREKRRARKTVAHAPGKHPKRKLALRLSAAAAVFLLLVGGGLVLRAYLTSRGIFKGGGNSALLHDQNVDPSQLKGEGDGRVNVLVLGKGGAEQHDGPDLTDTLIVASIDPLAKEAALLSIPRDFWVRNQGGGAVKINQIYADAKQIALNKYAYQERDSGTAQDTAEAAGMDAIKKVVTDTMGVPIHYYVMIDFAGFKKAVDTVGGIDINVTEELAVREYMWLAGAGKYYLDVGPGQQHFDGTKALAFSRSRKTSARGDFARAERQRAVIVALKEKILTVGTLANPFKLNQLLSDFGGQLSTDFSTDNFLRLYDLSKEITADKIASVGLDDHVTGSMINGLSVQIPKAGQFDYSEIQDYVRNIMRDAFLKREDAKVVVLNGTRTPGLATKRAKELKSFGYNVTLVDDAPTDTYTQTVLVSLSGDQKRYTKNYLEKRFNLTATGTLPDSTINATGADFVIILGTDSIQ